METPPQEPPDHPHILFSFLADFFHPLAYRRLHSPFWAGFSTVWVMILALAFCSFDCQGPVPRTSPWHRTWQGLCHPHVFWKGLCHLQVIWKGLCHPQVLFHSPLEPQNLPGAVLWDHSYFGVFFSSWQPRVPPF